MVLLLAIAAVVVVVALTLSSRSKGQMLAGQAVAMTVGVWAALIIMSIVFLTIGTLIFGR